MLSLLFWDKLPSMPQITRNSWRCWHFSQSWKFFWNLVLFALEINESLANDRKRLQSIFEQLIFLKFRFLNNSMVPEWNSENKKIWDTFLVSPPNLIYSKLFLKPQKNSTFVLHSFIWNTQAFLVVSYTTKNGISGS